MIGRAFSDRLCIGVAQGQMFQEAQDSQPRRQEETASSLQVWGRSPRLVPCLAPCFGKVGK